ncbi:ABC transporter substrate-binding protein [Schumannella sp. 10F1B-5-1]|uniref:ABC transporter substrate-binding protein n=1 Tax=Schumannella sp. 10F1B-5-1 TaxID=2590780 RepID=UPI001131DD55|nr:extracellular solute-binding protein [Schumannella sp. 10F1B-5-1]TPW73065.1 extracellular solute-binding protein [Schumannella sp. 10F1B-5-1]
MKIRSLTGVALAAVVAVSLAACSTGTNTADAAGISKEDAATATSAEDFGGMDALVKAAKAEGELNVIALPPSWANYGKIIEGFEKKYGIKVNSANPDGSSAEEFAAVKAQKGQSTAPDVLDVGTAVLEEAGNIDLLASYKVDNWDDIPDDYKDAEGRWYYDYTGVMSIGYDSSVIKKAPTKIDDLLGSDYKGKVAIVGDPTQANQAASAVYWAALQKGGSADDISKGIDWFADLKKAGNFQAVTPTQATVASGETPVILQWSYNNLAWGGENNENYKTVVLKGAALGSYYNQAISADAPHPAAARLWQEWIYSPEVQNLYLQAGAFPSTLDAMVAAGTVDEDALKAAGGQPADLVQLTAEQATTAGEALAAGWAAAIS